MKNPSCPVLWLSAALLSTTATASAAPNDATGTEQLFAAARIAGQRCVVQIQTVGGVQPPSAAPATVHMQNDDDEDQPAPTPDRESLGSNFAIADGPTTGIIYSADGLIITSSFNFVRDPSVITVKLPDGQQLAADIVARDHVRKLALLRVKADNLPTPDWAPREQIRVGEWALALGRGLGGDTISVSVGIVSALNRMAGNAIQTDANLSPINYGGPLVDADGRVMGICVPMAQRPGELAGVEMYDSGIGFAIPSWRLREIADELAKGRSFHRGWLGVSADPHVEDGVRIAGIADPSPMRDAGAQVGDYITRINGREIQHYGHMTQALYMIPAGDEVTMQLLRDAEKIDITVRLALREEIGELAPVAEPFDPSLPTTEPDEPTPPED